MTQITAKEVERQAVSLLLDSGNESPSGENFARIPPHVLDEMIQAELMTATSARVERHGLVRGARLFLIPVLFKVGTPINDKKVACFEGASLLADELSNSSKYSINLLSRLISYDEVSAWSISDLKQNLETIVRRSEPAGYAFQSENNEDSSRTAPLYFIVGVAMSTSMPEVPEFGNSSRALALARDSLALQISDGTAFVQPTLLAPMLYRDALIEGMASAVDAVVKYMKRRSERVEIAADYTTPCSVTLALENLSNTAEFQLDLNRIGKKGVERVLGAAYAAGATGEKELYVLH